MDQLKRNGFWVATGVLGVAALVFWFVVVGGVRDETAGVERKVKRMVGRLRKYAKLTPEQAADPEHGLPVRPIAEYWESVAERLDAERKSIEQTYRRIDERFERIFTADRRGEFTLANFVTALQRAIEKDLGEKYAALLPEGKKVDEVFPIAEPPPQSEKEVPAAQKRFYIARALARAAKAAKVETIEGVEFDFAGGSSKGVKRGGDQDREQAAEAIRFDRIGTTLRVRMHAEDVPALVSAVLKENVPLFTVDHMRVEKIPFDIGRYKPWNLLDKMAPSPSVTEVKTLSDDVYIGDCDQSKPESKRKPPPLPEPVVAVTLELGVLDFEIPER